MINFNKRWPATVRNLIILIRKRWPAKASSKKMINFIKRWPATVRNLFILRRKRWPAKASSKKMINFNKRWQLLLIILKGLGGQSRLGQTTGRETLYFSTPSNHSKGSGRTPSISQNNFDNSKNSNLCGGVHSPAFL